MNSSQLYLQKTFAPHSTCFGCGPANPQGLRIASYVNVSQSKAINTSEWISFAEFKPESHHEAFPGMVNGGIIGALLDCHSNWTAAYALMRQANETHPPCTVTAYFNVSLKRPTPSDQNLSLKAKIKSIYSDRAEIIAELWAKVAGAEKLCASCEGLFVAVKEGHPAYHRW